MRDAEGNVLAAGDTVQVVKGCPYCGDLFQIGRPFIIHDLFQSAQPTSCCGRTDEDWCAAAKGEDLGMLCVQLKKFPPMEKLRGKRTQEPTLEPITKEFG